MRRLVVSVSMETGLFHCELPNVKRSKKTQTLEMQPPVILSPEPAFEPLKVIKTTLIQNSAAYFLLTSFVHRNQFLRDVAQSWGLIRPELLHIPRNAFDASLLGRSSQRLAHLTKRSDSTVLPIPSRALWIGDSRH